MVTNIICPPFTEETAIRKVRMAEDAWNTRDPGRVAPARAEIVGAPLRADHLGPWRLDAVHNVDCARGLAELPADCIDVVVTSPPYWGQRGADGLGSEADPRDYVARLTAVLAEA